MNTDKVTKNITAQVLPDILKAALVFDSKDSLLEIRVELAAQVLRCLLSP